MPAREDALTPKLREESVKYRGVTYTLRELGIGEFESINEKATRKIKVDDGTGNEVEIERVDGTVQARLMLAKCLVDPKGLQITEIPTRVYGSLNRLVQAMNFGEEVDELKEEAEAKKKADAETSGSTDEDSPGN